jgi:hypothetical protein
MNRLALAIALLVSVPAFAQQPGVANREAKRKLD